MTTKTRVTMVDSLAEDPKFLVEMYSPVHGWQLVRIFSFMHGAEGIWSKAKNEKDAIEFAKRLELSGVEKREVVVYETPDIPSLN